MVNKLNIKINIILIIITIFHPIRDDNKRVDFFIEYKYCI